jgi:5'-AMP-activated protein kinase regulatory gamma subunit
LDIGTKDVKKIRDTNSALDGFRLMSEHRINGVAVVDKNDKFVDALTAKDIKAIGEKVNLSLLKLPVLDYLERSRKMGGVKFTGEGTTCSENITLREVIKKLGQNKRHRIFVVDEENKVLRVISLGDVIKILCPHQEDD